MSEIGREHRPLDAGLANVREKVFPPCLVRMRRRETVLDDRAHVGQLFLLFARKALRRKLRVRHHDFLNPHFARLGNDLEDLVAPEMARGQDHVVPGNALQAEFRRFRDVAIGFNRRDWRRRNAFGGQFPLNLCPKRKFGVRSIEAAGSFVGRVDRRHPDDLRAGASGNFERNGIQTTDTVIQCNGAVGLDSRNGAPYNLGSFSRRNVV